MHRVFCSLTVLLSLLMATALAQDLAKVAPNNVKVEIDNADVRILRIHYGPHEKTAMHGHPDHVIVFMTDNHTRQTFAEGQTKELQAKAGQVVWRPALKHAVENLSDQPFDTIEIELKGKTTAADAATTKHASGQ